MTLNIVLICITLYALGLFVWMYMHPPKVTYDVYLGPVRVDVLPTTVKLDNAEVTLRVKTEVDVPKGEKPKDVPIPEEILEYCEQESEPHASEVRKRRARALYWELGNWEAVQRQLVLEDERYS